MTIQDLHDSCDNINLFSRVYIMDTDRNQLVWNKLLSEVPYNLLQLEVEYFKIVNDGVLIWIM